MWNTIHSPVHSQGKVRQGNLLVHQRRTMQQHQHQQQSFKNELRQKRIVCCILYLRIFSILLLLHLHLLLQQYMQQCNTNDLLPYKLTCRRIVRTTNHRQNIYTTLRRFVYIICCLIFPQQQNIYTSINNINNNILNN